MTPNLLDELEGVVAYALVMVSGVAWCNDTSYGMFATREQAEAVGKLLLEADARAQPEWSSYRVTHAPALADMAKRMEAAERKLSRLTGMRNEWERDAREHLMTFGQHLPASVECLVERFDAAIDATQEGEG